MRKLRADAKVIDMEEAARLYAAGESLRGLGKRYGLDHANILLRFRDAGISLRSRLDAIKATIGKPKPSQQGAKNHAWKGGFSVDKKGYLVNNRTHVREHREIAARILGRPLKTNEVVHHFKGKENTHGNMVICTKAYHSWLHARMENFLIGQNYRKNGG